RKLRTLLSMTSLFLGVLAVVLVQASSEAANRAAMADVELTVGKDGTLHAYLAPDALSVPVALDLARDRPGVVLMLQGSAILGEPGITPINANGEPLDGSAPSAGAEATSRVVCDKGLCVLVFDAPRPPGMAVRLRFTALSADVRQFRPFRQLSGQWLDFTSPPSYSPRVVV